MIIECINCGKKFKVDSEQIPSDGRNIQCGSCNYIWFFKKDDQNKVDDSSKIQETENIISTNKKISKQSLDDDVNDNFSEILIKPENKSKKQTNNYPKKSKNSKFTLFSLLSFILVSLITFVALIIIIDTFKTPLYNSYPNLEIMMFNLFETLTDISLFIKDLVK